MQKREVLLLHFHLPFHAQECAAPGVVAVVAWWCRGVLPGARYCCCREAADATACWQTQLLLYDRCCGPYVPRRLSLMPARSGATPNWMPLCSANSMHGTAPAAPLQASSNNHSSCVRVSVYMPACECACVFMRMCALALGMATADIKKLTRE